MMSGRAKPIAVLAVCAALLAAAWATPVFAQSAAEEAASAKARLREIRQSFSAATETYLDARYRWTTVREKLDRTEAELRRTKRRIQRAQRLLAMRVSHLYRTPDYGYVEVVLGSTDFQDFISGMEYLARIGRADADLVLELKLLKMRMKRQRRTLRGLEAERRVRASELGARAQTLQVQLAAQRETYSRLKRAAAIERQAHSIDARGSGIANINLSKGFVFPVDGPHSFSDDWGNPRSGGRTHKGTDIFASFGTPVVAVVSGSVDAHTGGLGGNAIWLSGSDGNSYYYAHLQGFEVTSGSVSQGQVIGYVGDTGNARGGAPHLHFGIQVSGDWVNPYRVLAAAD